MNAFHEAKKPAAVLKHAILDQYVTPFASKTGSTSPGGRVAFIDGYAGPGYYEDGSEGSAAMLIRKAHELKAMQRPRRAELHFVEQDAAVATRLRSVVEREGQGLEVTVQDGDIAAHLPGLLEHASGIPLFAYLDPCGLIIPMDQVASIFHRPGNPAATEVLINLTAHLRRFGGILSNGKSDKSSVASLKRIDDVCGGTWWRDAWLEKCPDQEASDDDRTAAELAVVEGYAAKLREHIGVAGSWVIDVRPRADLKPIYYLIFATRHVAGMTTFGASSSLGLKAWRKYLAKAAAQDTLFGDGGAWEEDWKAAEKVLDEQWVRTLVERITAELEKGQPFSIAGNDEILRDDLAGVVRNTHFRAAINQVRAAGKTTTETRGVENCMTLVITPA
ncbi:three-Cys-motif partner protein TcmP [Isoptericola jiangsuensis]|uniref:three-Cys-motif partner protein TcmP n=1 Tax=Isoptericola jiangsuensis TaxID=548579 RepID=UPI003AAF80E1